MDVFQPVFAAEAKLVNGRQKKNTWNGNTWTDMKRLKRTELLKE